jgi:hypothetical protein
MSCTLFLIFIFQRLIWASSIFAKMTAKEFTKGLAKFAISVLLDFLNDIVALSFEISTSLI